MSDDGITHAIGLIFDSSKAQDKIPGNYRPFELEGHLRGREVLLCRPDIVQEARKVICLVVIRPGREMCLHKRCACSWTRN
jgi:hypothetical protein